MQFHKISTILIWSADFRRLADWYQQTFDLQLAEELAHPQDTGIRFTFPSGDTSLWIGQHSQVHGQNPDPHRHMFNIVVDSVQVAYEDLLAKKVKFLAPPFKAPTFDKYFATMYDLDGNLVQIIGQR